jgi:anti-sigma factor RsiW
VTDHPDDSILHAYLDGALAPGERAGLEAHLNFCPACTEDLARARGLFHAIGGMSEESLGRDLAPAVLQALSPLPRWVPSLAIGELLGALGIGATLILGLGTSGILVGLSASSGRIAIQLEVASRQLASGWARALEQSRSFLSLSEIRLPELGSAGIWATIAIVALILWFVGNGLVLGQVRRKVWR